MASIKLGSFIMRIALVLFGSALLLSGCAKNASDVQATYTSPMPGSS
jgi:hypothetical protein